MPEDGDRRWALAGLSWAMVGGGVFLALFDTRLAPHFEAAVADSMWGSPTFPEVVVPYHRFVHGVLGGVIAGWGATLGSIQRGNSAALSMALGLTVWFVVDTAASLWWGVWPNALLNAAVLLAALGVLRLAGSPTGSVGS